MPKEKRDWVGFWIRFVFGSLSGAAFGVFLWSRSRVGLYNSYLAGVLLISVAATIVGLVAALSDE